MYVADTSPDPLTRLEAPLAACREAKAEVARVLDENRAFLPDADEAVNVALEALFDAVDTLLSDR